MAALLLIISFGIFSLLYIAPGNPVDALLGAAPRTPATVNALRQEYHLDQPFLTQYWIWLRNAVHLNFGRSIQTALPVTDEIKARLPTSLFLGFYAYALTMVLGVGLGVFTAYKRRTALDRAIVGASVIGLSTPAFVSGVFLLYLFAVVVHWFPVAGKGTWFWDELWHLTLPAVALALLGFAYVLKHARAAVIGVLDQDYVTFARSRGVGSTRILFQYALRNAMIPIVTISAVILSFVITGAVVVEETFSLSGIGDLLVQSATNRDLPMLQGVALVIAAIIMAANLFADLVYVAIDPRIALGRRR